MSDDYWSDEIRERARMTSKTPRDIEWLSRFETIRSQAEPIFHKLTAMGDISALREATEKLPQYLQAMRKVPEPISKEYRNSRKDMLKGLELYIKGCEEHIKFLETQRRWHFTTWQTFIDEASKKFENATRWLQKAR